LILLPLAYRAAHPKNPWAIFAAGMAGWVFPFTVLPLDIASALQALQKA
jgi:hypothetical protein